MLFTHYKCLKIARLGVNKETNIMSSYIFVYRLRAY